MAAVSRASIERTNMWRNINRGRAINHMIEWTRVVQVSTFQTSSHSSGWFQLTWHVLVQTRRPPSFDPAYKAMHFQAHVQQAPVLYTPRYLHRKLMTAEVFNNVSLIQRLSDLQNKTWLSEEGRVHFRVLQSAGRSVKLLNFHTFSPKLSSSLRIRKGPSMHHSFHFLPYF